MGSSCQICRHSQVAEDVLPTIVFETHMDYSEDQPPAKLFREAPVIKRPNSDEIFVSNTPSHQNSIFGSKMMVFRQVSDQSLYKHDQLASQNSIVNSPMTGGQNSQRVSSLMSFLSKTSKINGLSQHSSGNQKILLPDGSIYFGQTYNMEAHGQGTLRMVDETKYEGQWANGLQNGQGKLSTPDGTQYIGEFRDGLKHGKGILHMKDGSNYNGEFKENKIDGIGIFIWPDKRHYTGQWVNNVMHGAGIMIWPDGRSYEGRLINSCILSYKQGQKDGQGTYTWSDGRKYIGQWKNGKQHGKGILLMKNGTSKNGEWDKGVPLDWSQESAKKVVVV